MGGEEGPGVGVQAEVAIKNTEALKNIEDITPKAYLEAIADKWHDNNEQSARQQGTYNQINDALHALNAKNLQLRAKIEKLPPEIFSLLIKDISSDPSEIALVDINAIVESIESYDQSWTISREPDPTDSNMMIVKVMGKESRGEVVYGDQIFESPHIPEFISESARLNPEWKKLDVQIPTSGGEMRSQPVFVARMPKNIDKAPTN